MFESSVDVLDIFGLVFLDALSTALLLLLPPNPAASYSIRVWPISVIQSTKPTCTPQRHGATPRGMGATQVPWCAWCVVVHFFTLHFQNMSPCRWHSWCISLVKVWHRPYLSAAKSTGPEGLTEVTRKALCSWWSPCRPRRFAEALNNTKKVKVYVNLVLRLRV